MDGRPNWRNKALFSNFSGVVWTGLKPGKYEDGAFTLKTHQMFSVHTAPGEFKTQQILAFLDLLSRKTRAEKSHDNPNVIVSVKLHFCFPSTLKRNAGFFKFHRFEERFRQAQFS